MRIEQNGLEFSIFLPNNELLAHHTAARPMVIIGSAMNEPAHDLQAYADVGEIDCKEQLELNEFSIQHCAESWQLTLSHQLSSKQWLRLRYDQQSPHQIDIESSYPKGFFNRYWLRLHSNADERLYGGGHHCNALNLKGRVHGLFLYDSALATGARDLPLRLVRQSGFVSSRNYLLIAQYASRMVLDARKKGQLLLEVWGRPKRWMIASAQSFSELLQVQSKIIGRPHHHPKDLYTGIISGFRGPFSRMQSGLMQLMTLGLPISALWLQDWARATYPTFGVPLPWNWFVGPSLKEPLKKQLQLLRERGLAVVAYMNGLLVEGSYHFNEADSLGYLLETTGEDSYVYPWQEFAVGFIDLSDERAFKWFVGLIKEYLLNLGVNVVMIDDGAQLPLDGLLCNEQSSIKWAHRWPLLLAKAVHIAVNECNLESSVSIISTTSWYKSARYLHSLVLAREYLMNYGGSWSLRSSFLAMLSGALSGYSTQISMIGYSNGSPASPELIIRHAELATFSPTFWLHEDDGEYQSYRYYEDQVVMAHLLRLGNLFYALRHYRHKYLEQAQCNGLPMLRPLFVHYDEDEQAKATEDQWLLGEQIMLCPILEPAVIERECYFPAGKWQHFSSSLIIEGPKSIRLSSPLGLPLAFYLTTGQDELLLRQAALAFQEMLIL